MFVLGQSTRCEQYWAENHTAQHFLLEKMVDRVQLQSTPQKERVSVLRSSTTESLDGSTTSWIGTLCLGYAEDLRELPYPAEGVQQEDEVIANTFLQANFGMDVGGVLQNGLHTIILTQKTLSWGLLFSLFKLVSLEQQGRKLSPIQTVQAVLDEWGILY